MKRMFVAVLALVCAGVLSGCHADARLYPVQGPLASLASPPVFAIRFTGGISKSGGMSATLANGEVCKGTWAQVPPAPPQGTGTLDNSGASPNMASAWDTVYGSGFYVAHILGQNIRIRGTISGAQGTTLTVEVYEPQNAPPNAGPSAVKGVAVDNNGNVYKLAF
jgi:hypothetical protein